MRFPNVIVIVVSITEKMIGIGASKNRNEEPIINNPYPNVRFLAKFLSHTSVVFIWKASVTRL